MRAIADPHGSRAAIALQVVERLLGKLGAAVEAIHELQRADAAAVRLLPAVLEPASKARRLLGEADAQERVKREGRITDPGIAIVPVPLAADVLGQAARRRRHYRSRRLERQELERDGGPLDDFSPAAHVSAPGQPPPPVGHGVAEEILRLIALQT